MVSLANHLSNRIIWSVDRLAGSNLSTISPVTNTDEVINIVAEAKKCYSQKIWNDDEKLCTYITNKKWDMYVTPATSIQLKKNQSFISLAVLYRRWNEWRGYFRGLAPVQHNSEEASQQWKPMTTLRLIGTAWESNPRPPAPIPVSLSAMLPHI